MPFYKIYAGLGGGFGGADYIATEEFDNEEDAEQYAFEQAVEEYQSYEGLRGLFNREEAIEENPDLTEEDLDDLEREDMESWIEYWVKEIDSIDE